MSPGRLSRLPATPRRRDWPRLACEAVIGAAGLLLPVSHALALWGDRLEVFVTQNVTRDDNVFRISSNLDTAAVLGASSGADTYSTTSLGFNLDVPVSRQRFQARMARNITRYDRFTVLNLDDGHDGRVAWLWQVGNDWGGQLGYTDTRALASLANTGSGVLLGTPNVLETRRGFVDAAYRLTPRWQLRGEASRLRQSNGVPVLRVNNVAIEGAGLAASYRTPAGNEVGLKMQVEDGRFPNRQPVAGSLIDNGYRQSRVAVVADWNITGKSRVVARTGWVGRNYGQLPQRDFDGTTYHVAYDWKPTSKLTLTAIAQRDISPLDDIYSRSVLAQGFALRPALTVTEKLTLSANVETSKREYVGDAALALGAAAPRTDTVRAASIAVAYRPLRTVTLLLGLQHETRSSTIAFGDYQVNVASIGLRFGF